MLSLSLKEAHQNVPSWMARGALRSFTLRNCVHHFIQLPQTAVGQLFTSPAPIPFPLNGKLFSPLAKGNKFTVLFNNTMLFPAQSIIANNKFRREFGVRWLFPSWKRTSERIKHNLCCYSWREKKSRSLQTRREPFQHSFAFFHFSVGLVCSVATWQQSTDTRWQSISSTDVPL